jgi:acyl-coenzyme A synthetase/AMP-(fatty) acid ligase
VVRPRPGQSCNSLELKRHCAALLPRYAIPHRFQITDHELPKSSTGKIDRMVLARSSIDDFHHKPVDEGTQEHEPA